MKISIENSIYEYIPDFNPENHSENGWRMQNQDFFKFIKLAGYSIFIKRFDKDKEHISGYEFLLKIKGQRIAGFPQIYDLVSQQEDGYPVYYLFQEALDGDILENIIRKSVLNFNPAVFSEQLYHALHVIASKGFWYTDFVEKNIFIGKDGHCYLIDLDSVASVKDVTPKDKLTVNDVNNNYKGAVCKDWFMYSYQYHKDEVSKIQGDTVNFLELIIFMGQFRYYIDNHSDSLRFLDTKTRKSVPEFFRLLDNRFFEAVFKSSFNAYHQKIIDKDLFTAVIQKLFPVNESLAIDFKNNEIRSLGQKKKQSNQRNEDEQKKINALLNDAKKDLEKFLFQDAKVKIRDILLIDPNAHQALSFFKKIGTAENMHHLLRDAQQALHNKNLVTAKLKANEALRIYPHYTQAKLLLKDIADEENKVIERSARLTREISDLESSNYFNSWFFRIIIHSFLGFGLFGITESQRKWIYPIANMASIVCYIYYYMPPLIVTLCVAFGSYIDVIVTAVNKTKNNNRLLKDLRNEKQQLLQNNQ